MKIIGYHIPGKSRGRSLGFPTINLATDDLDLHDLVDGIYAVWVTIGDKTYRGAMHYGPVPTFGESSKSLEIYLLDSNDASIGDLDRIPIQVTVVKRIRDILSFPDASGLVEQIAQDVKDVRSLLH